MAENLSLPNIPTSKMFLDDPDDRTLTIEWQEFFRGLWTRVGGLSAPTITEVYNALVSETYEVEGEDFAKRLEEIEGKLAALTIPKNYDKAIADLEDDSQLDIFSIPKSYDKRITELEQLVLALLDPKESDENKIAVILDTPKSYDNDIGELKMMAETLPSEPIVIPSNFTDELEFFISAVQAGDT